MSKIFRLYKEGTNTLQGWNETPAFPYNSNARDTIDDPDGASARNEITSIPSPFARIDLIKTAFKEVCRRASRDVRELEGKTIFHKMVSDSFDVGEIFFNIDKFKNKIEIITWNPSLMIEVLKNDQNVSHYYVADALQKYLLSDAKTYNFDQLLQGNSNIYILNYINGPDELNIIGATSPATLFFSGANNLEYIQDIFFANNDRPFDGDYVPLYRRDPDYIKAWWTLRKTISSFPTLFPEIENYLNLTFKAITDQSIKSNLNMITPDTAKDFSLIDIRSNQQRNQVEVLGTPLFKKKVSGKIESDFTLQPERAADGVKPLVLPVEAGNKYASLQYANGTWGNTNKAPYKSKDAIDRRILPHDGSTFAYLTISDFLEDFIVKVPHTLNNKYFFDGNIKDVEQMTSFLVPIKPLYFKYFSIDTLNSTMPDGKLAFEMETIAGGSVNVIIRIPITGNGNIKYVEYQRIYYAERQANVSETQNTGAITTFDFTGLVMPCMRFQNEGDAIYTVSCFSSFSKLFRFEFYRKGEIIRDTPVDCRNKEKGLFDYKAETYTIQHSNFDFIRVSDKSGISNIIIPKFLAHQNLENYEFAVDLGTSNTHIEFKKSNENSSHPFNYKDTEPVFGTFFILAYREIEGKQILIDTDEYDLMIRDFIPTTVGADSNYFFPTRTALSYAKSTDWTENLRTFGLTNFDMTYGKRIPIAYNDVMLNIKWSNKSNAQSAMQAYIRNIMMIIRNKVIANNGNLAQTKITWFYPNSMSPRRLAQLRTAWNDSYRELFNQKDTTRSLSESVAPIQFYFRRYATATNLVNIDIGGGTTDIAFSSNGKVEYITSFKFAANSLFEDSFSDINPNNGIVDSFKDDILRLLKSKSGTELNELANILERNEGHPANMASFLFSLKDNSATKGLARNNIDFNKILQNDKKFKIVFIIFYTAIIYHIAQIIKAKGLKVPRHIAFSGNGSRIINIISTDPKILGRYTKIIFEKTLGTEYGTGLDILGLEPDSKPKESTCKGGLIAAEAYDDVPETLILFDSYGNLASTSDTYSSISDTHKAEIVKSVKDFFHFVLKDIPSAFNLDKNFGVDNVAMKIAMNEYTKDLETYLDKGIELSIKETGNKDNPIEDAITFYPIKGVLQSLSSKIQEYYLENPNK